MNFATLLLLAPPILAALTFHEYAHACAAYRYGGDTAKQLGRLGFNPLRHLDPLGTIMIFLVHYGCVAVKLERKSRLPRLSAAGCKQKPLPLTISELSMTAPHVVFKAWEWLSSHDV